MNEQYGPMNNCGGYGHRPPRFLMFLVPLAVGYMIGKRSGMFRGGFGPHGFGPQGRGPQGAGFGRSWENGVPPFFAELHRRAHAADQPPVTEA